MISSIIILIVCLFLSMFFSGAETAVTAASEALIHEKEKKSTEKVFLSRFRMHYDYSGDNLLLFLYGYISQEHNTISVYRPG